MKNKELTMDEMVSYGNYAMCEKCDFCGHYHPLFYDDDVSCYIIYNGNNFVCTYCLHNNSEYRDTQKT